MKVGFVGLGIMGSALDHSGVIRALETLANFEIGQTAPQR